VLDLLLPQRCLVCARTGMLVCAECRHALRPLTPALCVRCGAPTAWPVERCFECSGRRLAFASARSAVVYDERVRALVGAWKERGLRGLALLAAELVADRLERPAVGTLTFVPADGERRLRRGHHPAERLTRELARLWDLPAEPLLTRTRAGPRQRGLSLPERRRNVRDAYLATGKAPARVALVDDVYTSGATANAAASALRKAGAKRIEVLTFARAVRGYTVRHT
jgi:predicted amidophosphoribosyltransferase